MQTEVAMWILLATSTLAIAIAFTAHVTIQRIIACIGHLITAIELHDKCQNKLNDRLLKIEHKNKIVPISSERTNIQ